MSVQVTASLVTEARAWVADCEWADDTSELTDAQVIAGVGRHYDGGWDAFVADGQDTRPVCACGLRMVWQGGVWACGH